MEGGRSQRFECFVCIVLGAKHRRIWRNDNLDMHPEALKDMLNDLKKDGRYGLDVE